jgi:O-antigen ligase
MMNNTQNLSLSTDPKFKLFYYFAAFVLICIAAAVCFELWYLAFLPILPLGLLLTVLDYKKIYLFLWAAVPISTEITLPNGLGTDLPVEPIIIGLLGIYFLLLISRPQVFELSFFNNPITILLIAHLLWTVFITIFAADLVISTKFLLAKIWYVGSFYFFTAHVVRSSKDYEQVLCWFFIPFLLAVLKVVLHHATLHFGFKEINTATSPFFRNHVNYAAIIALSLPIIYFIKNRFKTFTVGWLAVNFALILLFIALIFAYTRAAYVALFLAFGAYFIIKLKMVRYVLVSAMILLTTVFIYFYNNNKFMDFAPSERTVAHTDLNDIVAATYKLEDVSTMERYYRWIASLRMANEDIYTGFGGGSFYHNYKFYTLNRFQTYVSDNPEQSGVHNYYLMLLAEQGLIGMLIFILLNFATLLYGEKLYHQLSSPALKNIAMACMLSQIVIFAFLLMNDMVETDKVGSFFFFNMAILAALPRWKF